MGVPVPSKWDRSLITWDRSQIFEFFGTGPITLLLNNLMEEIIYFGLILGWLYLALHVVAHLPLFGTATINGGSGSIIWHCNIKNSYVVAEYRLFGTARFCQLEIQLDGVI